MKCLIPTLLQTFTKQLFIYTEKQEDILLSQEIEQSC